VSRRRRNLPEVPPGGSLPWLRSTVIPSRSTEGAAPLRAIDHGVDVPKGPCDALLKSGVLKSTRTGVVVPFDIIKPAIAAWIEAPHAAARPAPLNHLTRAVAQHQAPDAKGKADKR